jgi:hypothetical protein
MLHDSDYNAETAPTIDELRQKLETPIADYPPALSIGGMHTVAAPRAGQSFGHWAICPPIAADAYAGTVSAWPRLWPWQHDQNAVLHIGKQGCSTTDALLHIDSAGGRHHEMWMQMPATHVHMSAHGSTCLQQLRPGLPVVCTRAGKGPIWGKLRHAAQSYHKHPLKATSILSGRRDVCPHLRKQLRPAACVRQASNMPL